MDYECNIRSLSVLSCNSSADEKIMKSPVKNIKKLREVYISPYCRLVFVPSNFMKFGIRGQLTDVITYVKFLVDRFRGYGVLTSPKLPFPIDLLRRPYNSVALPCDTVIRYLSTLDLCQHIQLLETVYLLCLFLCS